VAVIGRWEERNSKRQREGGMHEGVCAEGVIERGREGERKSERMKQVPLCVCVCVRERERAWR